MQFPRAPNMHDCMAVTIHWHDGDDDNSRDVARYLRRSLFIVMLLRCLFEVGDQSMALARVLHAGPHHTVAHHALAHHSGTPLAFGPLNGRVDAVAGDGNCRDGRRDRRPARLCACRLSRKMEACTKKFCGYPPGQLNT
jgi:hypothetical protein